MNIEELAGWLERRGFSEREARVLAYLLARGSSTVAEISRALEMPRPHIYDVLDRLLRKGLVAKVGRRPAVYTAWDAVEEISRMVEEEHMEDRRVLETLRARSLEESGTTTVFYGFKALARRFSRVITSAHSMLWLLDPPALLTHPLMHSPFNVDLRIVVGDLEFVKNFDELPACIRYVKPLPPLIIALNDTRGLVAILLGGEVHAGVEVAGERLEELREYFEHVWSECYAATVRRMRARYMKGY